LILYGEYVFKDILFILERRVMYENLKYSNGSKALLCMEELAAIGAYLNTSFTAVVV